MMIPPIIRLGYPTEPQPLIEYVCLTRQHGWQMLSWRPDLGWHHETVLYPGSNGFVDVLIVDQFDILCWMPQDGS